jgi:ribosomal protein S18 acetylase RimI-like enzyme
VHSPGAERRRDGVTLHTTDLMQAAVRLYERLGFERAHDLDFEPAPGIIAKGYRLDLSL